ncbi:hypothetical protein CEXT_748661 [Caerostris extrusa]|uniref:Uncharacterized protein n=1 Tax=Caerostris extrusa TaxID=172846 RepID=A0AAV4UDE0_CAEEX|nr:hypothetical protein CEXT_748661 [Caerostris extrusa]
MYGSKKDWKEGRKGGWMEGRMGGWVDGWMDGWMDRRTERRKDERKDGWMEGKKEGWRVGWTEGRCIHGITLIRSFLRRNLKCLSAMLLSYEVIYSKDIFSLWTMV